MYSTVVHVQTAGGWGGVEIDLPPRSKPCATRAVVELTGVFSATLTPGNQDSVFYCIFEYSYEDIYLYVITYLEQLLLCHHVLRQREAGIKRRDYFLIERSQCVGAMIGTTVCTTIASCEHSADRGADRRSNDRPV